MQPAKTRPHTECVFQQNSHQQNDSINPVQTLSTHNLGDEPPAVAASGTISAQRRNPKSEKQKTRKLATQNLQPLPKSQYTGSQTQPVPLHKRPLLLCLQPQRLEFFAQQGRRVMEHGRHRLPGALRLLQSFLGHLDNELVATCSPFDSRDRS